MTIRIAAVKKIESGAVGPGKVTGRSPVKSQQQKTDQTSDHANCN
jgi:hypothetical protein